MALDQMEEADLVVVGAGTAGAVVASRVTERRDRAVLLLEAGPDYAEPEGVPADLRDGTRNAMTSHDWHYVHKPTKEQFRFPFPRGKVVGGSSAVNTCIALRGQPYDYDEWAALGLPEWSWEKCLPAFKRLEHDLDFEESPWHGSDGPLPIRRHRPSELTPWQAAFLEACTAVGYPPLLDINDPGQTGAGMHAMNKIGGERISSARAYLGPSVRARAGLRIRPDTLVRRVLVTNRRVTGLELDTHGRVHTIPARRVVLCAGAIATPGILLRSGIGPREQVARLGVTLVADLPAVAARLLDHPGLAIFFRPIKGVQKPGDPLIQAALHTALGRGQGARANDLLVQPGSFVPAFGFTWPLVSLMACIGKPRGAGTLRWDDPNPRAAPVIVSNLLGHPDDRAAAATAVERLLELAQTPALRSLARPFWPASRRIATREGRLATVPLLCDSGYHPCGTVPMGPEGAPDAAVDERGRVRGVLGLWVADASIFPTIPTANTNLTTLMVGERFGAWLRDAPLQ